MSYFPMVPSLTVPYYILTPCPISCWLRALFHAGSVLPPFYVCPIARAFEALTPTSVNLLTPVMSLCRFGLGSIIFLPCANYCYHISVPAQTLNMYHNHILVLSTLHKHNIVDYPFKDHDIHPPLEHL